MRKIIWNDSDFRISASTCSIAANRRHGSIRADITKPKLMRKSAEDPLRYWIFGSPVRKRFSENRGYRLRPSSVQEDTKAAGTYPDGLGAIVRHVYPDGC